MSFVVLFSDYGLSTEAGLEHLIFQPPSLEYSGITDTYNFIFLQLNSNLLLFLFLPTVHNIVH